MTILQLLLPDFLLILAGAFICRLTPLNRDVWEPVERIVYYVLFPALLFHSITRSPIDPGSAVGFVSAGLALCATGVLTSYLIPNLPWIGRHTDRRQFAGSAQVAFRFNSFIALALAQRIGGPEGLLTVSMLIGFCVPVLNVAAVWPMARHANKGFAKELMRNPLVIATLSGLLCNLVGLQVPVWAEPAVQRMGQGSLALGLMAAGAGMRLGSIGNAKVLSAAVLTIKHLLMPMTGLLISHLWGLPPGQAAILVMFSALPTASSCYVLAARMGYDGALVAALVTLSTGLSVLSLSVALAST